MLARDLCTAELLRLDACQVHLRTSKVHISIYLIDMLIISLLYKLYIISYLCFFLSVLFKNLSRRASCQVLGLLAFFAASTA